jgi:hypothetical protein
VATTTATCTRLCFDHIPVPIGQIGPLRVSTVTQDDELLHWDFVSLEQRLALPFHQMEVSARKLFEGHDGRIALGM